MSFLITWMNLEVIMLSKISQIERQKSHGITYVKSLKIESWKEAKNRKVVTRVCLWVSALLCPTLCDIIDSSLPGSSVHGIFEARITEWIAISFSRGLFSTQGPNPHLLHWQAGFLLLCHLGRHLSWGVGQTGRGWWRVQLLVIK